jgi:hypothetical protein
MSISSIAFAGEQSGLAITALEGVEIDDHRVEPLDAVIGEHREVVGPVADGRGCRRRYAGGASSRGRRAPPEIR